MARRTTISTSTIALTLALHGIGCSNPGSASNPNQLSEADTANGCSAGSAGSASECAIKPGANLCTSIPKFSGAQVVDGSGNDFCDVPATIFAVKDGFIPGKVVPKLPDVLKARVAWDAAGIHAHFHVDAPNFRSDDNVELDIGGGVAFAGGFNGVTSDASSDLGFVSIVMGVHYVGSVGDLTFDSPAVAWATYIKSLTSSGQYTQPLVAPGQFAYREVTGGYELELFVPWALLNRNTAPSSGTAISAALGLNAGNDQVVTHAWQTITPTSAPGPCGSTAAPTPNCDDRTWCSPTLE